MKLTVIAALVALPAILNADSKITTRYQMAGQSSESTAYNKGQRTRFEAPAGIVMIQQCDTKRMIAVDPNSRTYSVSPLDVPVPQAPAASAQSPASAPAEAKGDKVLHKVTLTDAGETRTMFGRTARRIKTLTLNEPGPQACERKKMKIETDGWYIDGEQPSACSLGHEGKSECNDDVKTEVSGNVKLGLPVAYTMVMTETAEDGSTTTSEIVMEVVSASFDPLDAALFEPPDGFTEAGGLKELAQQAAGKASPASAPPKTPGVARLGVASPNIRTGNSFAAETFRDHLATQISQAKYEAYPVDGKLGNDRTDGAKRLECDYLIETDLVELKKSTSKFGGIMKAASAVSSMGSAPPSQNYEAKIDYRLIDVATGSPVASGSVSGKTAGDFNVKTAMSLASTAMAFAPTGMMAKAFMANPKLMSMMMQNPALNGMLGSGMGGMGMGGGFGSLDPGAMAYMGMAQKIQSAMSAGEPALPQAGPDESAAIKNALANVMKSVNGQIKKR